MEDTFHTFAVMMAGVVAMRTHVRLEVDVDNILMACYYRLLEFL